LGCPRLLFAADRPARADRFPNFHRHATEQGAQLVTHHAKASSAGSTEGSGTSRGLLPRAFAIRGSSSDSKGSGAHSNGRTPIALIAALAAIAALAFTAAPASADSAQMGSVSNVSYASAGVTGTVSVDGFFAAYSYECSTNETDWSVCASDFLSKGANQAVPKTLEHLKGGTHYFVRLTVGGVSSPATGPYPSFTTLTVEPPTIPGTVAATEIFSLSAKATGKVKRPANADPAFNVECHFEYITDAQFEENVNVNSLPGFEGATPAPCEQNPITAPNAEPEVSAQLTGLSPSTAYRLRLVAENAAPGSVVKEAAAPFTTAAKVAKPTVISIAAPTEVSYRSAKASGTVERPAGADPALDISSCRFEYVSDQQFDENEANSLPPFEGAGQAQCQQTETGPITDSGPTTVNAILAHLKSGVEYHLRLAAENSSGAETKDAANTFTTTPGGEPTGTLDPSPIAGYTNVRLSGTAARGLGFGNSELYAIFQYAEAGTENFCCGNAAYVQLPPGSGPKTFNFVVRGLNQDTEYEFRMLMEERNSGGESSGELAMPFKPTATTGHLESPSATLDPVGAITGTGAHFSGTVDTHAPAGPLNILENEAYATHWEFQCTPECPGPGGEPLSGTVQGEEGAQPVSGDPIHLQPNTYYEVKLIAHNELYTVETPLQTFQTPLILPTVKAEAGASDGEGGYFIQGIVNSNNSKVTSCVIEYGTTATYPNTYQAPCLPNPSGPDEVQNISIDATEGQFKLSFRGQTTSDLPFNASTAEVQTALRALSQVGPAGVNVTGSPGAYVVTFAGKLAGANVEPIKASDGSTPLGGGGGAGVSTAKEGGIDHPVTIEAHVENLTIDAHYHFRIFATNAAGSASSADREFVPTLAPPRPGCENEAIRKENSSEALPECRAYEMVTPSNKQGYGAKFFDYDAGTALVYGSKAEDIDNSGQGSGLGNLYTAVRTNTGWQTRPNLNGPSGSDFSGPDYVPVDTGGVPHLSKDLLSWVWVGYKESIPGAQLYLRKPDGTFALMGKPISNPPGGAGGFSGQAAEELFVGASDDLGHQVYDGSGTGFFTHPTWGPGVYEFVGVDDNQPRRIDLDNLGSPISGEGCEHGIPGLPQAAAGNAVSREGRVIFFTALACPGGLTHEELWARVGGVSSFDVSASHCTRVDCNAAAEPHFQGDAGDGFRVFFTTTQQLVNGDTDPANDLYACDIPLGTPAPVGEANPCSSFRQISVAETGAAEVENVLGNSENGSTVLFTAKGVLADNEDALEEQAVAGDKNLYAWRTDAAHPDGQITFVGRLTTGVTAQITPDGRYLALDTAASLLPTDTDDAVDVYRYDTDTGEMVRASTGPTGTGGNGDGFAAKFPHPSSPSSEIEHNPNYSISDDGQKIVFSTAEPLSPVDGNGEPDAYLWTPSRVSLISTGTAGIGEINIFGEAGQVENVAISGSGQDIYFETSDALSPADGDEQTDVYDARIDGGFSFAEQAPCSGEACRPGASTPPAPKSPGSQVSGLGNPSPPKACPKGKVKKHGKCVKKHTKGQKHKNSHKRTGHSRGGSK
jgi:hypothetical protein